jgi:ParB family chromosome partitioning protein
MSTNEWFTPPFYVEAARTVMGSIELDPASCEVANRTVGADRYFTKEDNALMHPWVAESVFLNPPYGRVVPGGASNLGIFTSYLLEQYVCGNTKQAVLLVPANTATSWFAPLWSFPICFPWYRIQCLQRDGKPTANASLGTCFVYLGPNVRRVCDFVMMKLKEVIGCDHDTWMFGNNRA